MVAAAHVPAGGARASKSNGAACFSARRGPAVPGDAPRWSFFSKSNHLDPAAAALSRAAERRRREQSAHQRKRRFTARSRPRAAPAPIARAHPEQAVEMIPGARDSNEFRVDHRAQLACAVAAARAVRNSAVPPERATDSIVKLYAGGPPPAHRGRARPSTAAGGGDKAGARRPGPSRRIYVREARSGRRTKAHAFDLMKHRFRRQGVEIDPGPLPERPGGCQTPMK